MRNKRNKEFSKKSLMPILPRFAAAFIGFLVAPIVISNCGIQVFGIFSLFVGLRFFQSFSDLGVANALLGVLIERSNIGRREFSTLVLKLLIFNLFTASTLSLLAIQFKANELFEIPGQLVSQFNLSILMFFFGSVPSFTLLFVQKISLARGNYLESSAYVNGIYSISNIGILCASFLGNPLPVMIAMLVLLPSVVSSIVLFRMSFHFSKETTIEHFDWSFYRFSAFPFLVLQVATAVSTQVDSVLIGAFLGPIQVGVYAATFKFVSIAMMMISISLAPVWPTVSKLLNSENRKDVPKYIKGTVKTYSFIAILISLSFFFSLDYLTGKTYNDVFDLPLSLKVTVSIWIFVFVFWQLLSAFLNGFGMEMWLSKVYTLGAIASVSLSIVSIHIFKDISATVAASTFSCVAFLIFPMSRKVHRLVLSNE